MYNRFLFTLLFVSFLFIQNAYSQVTIHPTGTTTTNSTNDVWIEGVENEFNNPLPLTTPQYSNFEIKRLSYGNGFLKIGTGDARLIQNNFHVSSITNNTCSSGNQDGLITYFDERNRHQWTAQLGLCVTYPSSSFTDIVDVSTDEVGNVLVVFRVTGIANNATSPIALSGLSVVGRMHRNVTPAYTSWSSGRSDAPFIVPVGLTGNTYNRTYIARISQTNTSSPQILVRDLNITYPNWTNPSGRDNNFSNLRIEPDNRGGLGFYISGTIHRSIDLQIGQLHFPDPSPLSLPTVDNTFGGNTTFIVRYNDMWQPVWAKRIVTDAVGTGATVVQGLEGNKNIDLVVDEQGNPYIQIAHQVGIIPNTVRAISANQSTPNPSNMPLSPAGDIGIVNNNGIEASIGFSLTRFDMMTGAMNWTNSGTNYGIPVNIDNTMHSKLAISNDRLYVLGEFGFSGTAFIYPTNETELSSTLGMNETLTGEAFSTIANRNLLLVSYDLNGKLEWSRSATGISERAYTIDVDREGNAYALVGYQNALTMQPFSVTSSQAGHALLKISPCGHLFWLENAFTSSALYANTSMCFVNRDQLYIGARHVNGTTLRPNNSSVNTIPGLGGNEYIIRLRDMPLANCSGSGTTLTASNPNSLPIDNWTNLCSSITGNPSLPLAIPANTEGVYSVDLGLPSRNLESNALWISSTPAGTDFEIVGVSPVCTNAGYTYTISNVQSSITYDWFLDGNPIAVATGSNYTATWTNATGSTLTHTLVVRATDGNCIFERSFIVEVPTNSPEVDASDFSFCLNDAPATIQIQVTRPSSVPLGIPLRYSWTPTTGLNNPNIQNPTLDLSGITGSAQYIVEVTLLDGTCVGRGVSDINLNNPQASLDIPTVQMCNADNPIVLSGGLPSGGEYSGVGVTPIITGGITTYQFDPTGLGGTYEITYTYDENGCEAEAMDVILVISQRHYKIQAFGCINDPSRSPNPNPNNDIVVTIYPSIKSGDRLNLSIPNPIIGLPPILLTPQPLTSGDYFNFSGIPIGTVITATIVNNGTGQCDARIINGDITTTNITVAQAPDNDIYLKDHPLDFGQQPSGERSYNSPSITITLEAPPIQADFIIPQHGQIIKYYYDNSTTHQIEFNEVQSIVTTHRAQLYTNQTSYLYLRVFNRTCKDFGKGLEVDALVARAVTNFGLLSDWTRLTQPVYLPKDIQAGGEVVIAIPIDYTTLGIITTYHTCTMARIIRCTNVPGVTCVAEKRGFDLFNEGIVESNNMTWRNINVISDAQGESEVTILNDGTTPKMTRVNFGFTENQDPNNAHYLENNDLVISMPETLAQRWQQNNYAKNNLAFVDNDHKVLRMPQHRNSWFEVLLMPGERFRIGLDFDIETITSNTPPQESIYYFDVTQYNEGELMGGVGYELLIDFIDVPPVVPSGLGAQVLSSSSIKLDWTDNSTNEQVFVLERNKVGTSTYVHVANVNADAITYTDLGLDPYTFYQYRLKAISNTGLSSSYIYSPQVRTLDAVPAAPTNLVATLRSDCKVDLNWVDNASNEYRYEVVRILNGVSTSVSTTILANSQSYLDNISITEGGTYTYKVRARSATGLYSDYTTFDLVITAPATPTLNAVVFSDGQVDLSWNRVPSVSTHYLEKKIGSTWNTLITVASSTTSFPDRLVSAGQTYEYRLRSREGCIFSLPSTQLVSMPVLPAPTNFIGVYDPIAGSISLTWTDNAQSENEYVLERIPLGGSSSTFSLGANTIAHIDANLGNYPSYTYRLYAKTALGVTSFRAETTVILPPTQVKISGFIRNHFNSSFIGSVIVELVNNSGVVLSEMTTDATGYYEFMVDINSSFIIRPKKDINMMNGVDLQDKALAEYYITRGGIRNLPPYLLIAADLNGDCDINIADYYLIVDATRSINPVVNFSVPSWQFVPSDYDIAIQGYCPFEQTRSYTNISSELIDQDFIGIKSGDVTGDANSLLKVSKDATNTIDLLDLKVVPNPFSERTELFFGSSVSTSATIRVYNTLGVEIYTTTVDVVEGNNSHTLSIKAPAGLYYVNIVGESINYTSKLVIEK